MFVVAAPGRLLTTDQMQRALARQGLPTKVVFDCTKQSPCPAKALGIPHLVGELQAKKRSTTSLTFEAWVLDSTRAANTYLKLAGSASWRLQKRNVVIAAFSFDDRRKAKAALAALP